MKHDEKAMIDWLRATFDTEPYVTTDWSEAPGARVIIMSIDMTDDHDRRDELYALVNDDAFADVAADFGYEIYIHDDPDFVEAAYVPLKKPPVGPRAVKR